MIHFKCLVCCLDRAGLSWNHVWVAPVSLRAATSGAGGWPRSHRALVGVSRARRERAPVLITGGCGALTLSNTPSVLFCTSLCEPLGRTWEATACLYTDTQP